MLTTVRFAAVALTALSFAACSGEGGSTSANGVKVDPYLGDVVMGQETAPVTIVEYASRTCSHCRDFWKQDFPQLKANYIDTGKVKYILKDFPTDPDIAVAGIGIARCKGKDSYYAIVDDFFTSQYDILVAARDGGAGAKLAALGARHGITPDELAACVDDKGVREMIEKVGNEGREKGVKVTPTVFVNDKAIEDHRYPFLSAMIEHTLDPTKPMPTAQSVAGQTTEAPSAPPVAPTPAPAPAQPPAQ